MFALAEINWRKEKWKHVSADAQALVKEMLQADPTSRPTISDILAHSWLSDNDVLDKIQHAFSNAGVKSPFKSRAEPSEDEPLAKRRKTEPSPMLTPPSSSTCDKPY